MTIDYNKYYDQAIQVVDNNEELVRFYKRKTGPNKIRMGFTWRHSPERRLDLVKATLMSMKDDSLDLASVDIFRMLQDLMVRANAIKDVGKWSQNTRIEDIDSGFQVKSHIVIELIGQLLGGRKLQFTKAEILGDGKFEKSSIYMGREDKEEKIKSDGNQVDDAIGEEVRVQRNSSIISEKKKVFVSNNGEMFCEICGFNPLETYGDIASGLIDCHHLTPVSVLGTDKHTDINDLILVCANCHKVIHRYISRGIKIFTLEEIKRMIQFRFPKVE